MCVPACVMLPVLPLQCDFFFFVFDSNDMGPSQSDGGENVKKKPNLFSLSLAPSLLLIFYLHLPCFA